MPEVKPINTVEPLSNDIRGRLRGTDVLERYDLYSKPDSEKFILVLKGALMADNYPGISFELDRNNVIELARYLLRLIEGETYQDEVLSSLENIK